MSEDIFSPSTLICIRLFIDRRAIRPRFEFFQTDDVSKASIIPESKGSTTITEFYPKNTITGKVIETRKLSRFGKPEEFVGDIVFDSKGGFKEVIGFGDDILRVTEVDEAGKGVVKLFKGEELLESSKVLTNQGDDFFKNIKTSTEKIDVDKTFKENKNILEFREGGKSFLRATDDQGNVLLGFGDDLRPSKRIISKGEIKTSEFGNIET